MRRRDVLAGVGSLGVLAAGGAFAVRGPPAVVTDAGSGSTDDRSREDEGEGEREDGPVEGTGEDGPIEIETIDAPGSEAGTMAVPADAPATVVMFFVTGCGNCQAQMPRLAEARERLGDEVRFLSVTYQTIGETVEADYLAEWWADHEGSWPVGHDPDSRLANRYGVVGFPVTIVLGADGEMDRRDAAVLSADEIVERVEAVLEDADGDD